MKKSSLIWLFFPFWSKYSSSKNPLENAIIFTKFSAKKTQHFVYPLKFWYNDALVSADVRLVHCINNEWISRPMKTFSFRPAVQSNHANKIIHFFYPFSKKKKTRHAKKTSKNLAFWLFWAKKIGRRIREYQHAPPSGKRRPPRIEIWR